MHKSISSSLIKSTKTFSPSTSISTISKLVGQDGHVSTETIQTSLSAESQGNFENAEFSSKRWVWIPDPTLAFIKGFVTEDLPEGKVKVRCIDDSVSITCN